ncbi:adenylate/guanylate cyclase domain-containing protein [Rhizobium hidalgonense]|uniref:Adenylate/guanylate cyclase domain-containing protein n=1 Tax=Rhizobium hidalgonense TaxID=1538159 RepID=A0A2A6KFN2_9HYPH|nr:adenylate/guanylate cyclase domain-containing protein [Rhizobium hidalgonense]MDR9772655.1 adenylate/guanylate cyclase domain-containing protein [Rhizobium hidalgonense]MDR9813800.1 adenylate/guanylate cyclase domain-containing protein [Rhizobium hidalgonense]MDR9821753.1 adenylate/guanylate cyclase domain-containing protein [Rhizobium hidalgonense]PDT23348.1 guanylyl cyclase [Rhizobium hidalgonense]PON02549.1 guanylyl cyclase [Rhizobium hidalgonense]
MDLPSSLAWLVDEAAASPGPDRFLAELGRRLLADGLALSGGALTLSVPHPIIARRTWLWRAETGAVIEALTFAAAPQSDAGREWLAGLGPVWEEKIGPSQDGAMLGWAGIGKGAGAGEFAPGEAVRLKEVARFAAAPLAALAAREARAALLEAYLGRRSAARVQSGALARGTGETIRAALLCADLRDFTALSQVTEPQAMISALDAYFDRVAGAVHAFGGEVLKFMGDGVLAIFPVTAVSGDEVRADREACEAALRAVAASRAGMAHLDQVRHAQGLAPLPFGASLHFGEILWGNIGAADRLDFTAIGPAVNLVSRLEGLCKPLGRTVLISGALAANTTASLMPLGEHSLRGIADPCAVFTLRED